MTRDEIRREFEIEDSAVPPQEDILFSIYSSGNYEGAACVVFRRDGELYVVEGSHCSCDGLRDQWHPTKTTAAALRLMKPDFCGEEDDERAWEKFLGSLGN